MNEVKKPGVMFYFDQCAIFRQMPMEDVYALVMATLDFAENGVVPEFKNPALTYVWSFIQLSVERDSVRYDRVVETLGQEAAGQDECGCMHLMPIADRNPQKEKQRKLYS